MSGFFYQPLMPSCQSWSGHFLDECRTESPAFTGVDKDLWLPPSGYQEKLHRVLERVLVSLYLWGYATVDLLWWAGLTITVYPMFKTGLVNHLFNLTSTLALYVFSISMHFGYCPKVDHFRFFHKNSERGELIHSESFLPRAHFATEVFMRDPIWHARDHDALLSRVSQAGGPRRTTYDRLGPINKAFIWGVNPNTIDHHGKPLMFYAAMNALCLYEGLREAFETNRLLPKAMRTHIDLTLIDHDGFDVLAYLLTGIHFKDDEEARRTRLVYFVHPHLENFEEPKPGSRVRGPISVLLRKGALLRETRFEEYRDFVQTVRDAFVANANNHPAKTAAMEAFRTQNGQNPHCYIRLVAVHLLSKLAQGNAGSHEENLQQLNLLLENANKLVRWKPQILGLWNEKRAECANAINAAFAANGYKGFLSGKNAHGTTLIVDYLMP